MTDPNRGAGEESLDGWQALGGALFGAAAGLVTIWLGGLMQSLQIQSAGIGCMLLIAVGAAGKYVWGKAKTDAVRWALCLLGFICSIAAFFGTYWAIDESLPRITKIGLMWPWISLALGALGAAWKLWKSQSGGSRDGSEERP